MKRLQVLLDEMRIWEREIYQKVYADTNWFKGKQSKHGHAVETTRKRTGLGLLHSMPPPLWTLTVVFFVSVLTRAQREIFDKVKTFVTDNRGKRLSINTSLTMPNTFPSRGRNFISTLSTDLHLSVTWDEYDEEDQNLVTLRLPESMEEPVPEPASELDGGEDGEQWEDVEDEDDEESRLAVDRVLKKYEQAPVKDDNEGGGFDARHEKSVNDKMDEWKRGYYKVGCKVALVDCLSSPPFCE